MSELSPEQAWTGVERGLLVLIDVRDGQDWRQRHPLNSRNIPFGEVAGYLEVLEELPVGIAFICADGRRSALAAGLVAARGRHDAEHVAGGLHAWVEAHLPVESALSPTA